MKQSTAKILVVRANPSRGDGYQVAHFVLQANKVLNLWERDRFLPTLGSAVRWVARTYPRAELCGVRQDCEGRTEGFCFECDASGVLATCRQPGRQSAKATRMVHSPRWRPVVAGPV